LAASTDQLLVSWALASGPAERDIAAPVPLTLEPGCAQALVSVAMRLDRFLRRLGGNVHDPKSSLEWRAPEFPLAKEFLAAGPLTGPFFWSRFDIFERADGGLSVLEYNCDKPAGQREIWAGAALAPGRSNPNRGARAAFRQALVTAWWRYAQRHGRAARPRAAILVDPSHREEFRLAYLYGREIHALGWPWTVVGHENLVVDGEHALAYGEPVDIILRQYPAEFLHELPAMPDLWRLARAGRLLWLNDPRAVAVQAKSIFAMAWTLASEERLSRADARLVRDHVPPTGLAADSRWLERAEARPEDWVIKPVLGRYSEGVALGAACSAEDWQRAIDGAAARPYDYVVQAYVPPRRRWLPAPGGERGGYVNWGVALAGGRFAGICPRLQPTPLTDEATTWWAPLRLGHRAPATPAVVAPRPALRAELTRHRARRSRTTRGPGPTWLRLAERCAMGGYTNVWTAGLGNFALAGVELSREAWDELGHATTRIGRATARALAHLDDPTLLAPLGIPPGVARACAARPAPPFLSRLDWARTTEGRWQLLEINSDTPAGLWETGLAAHAIAPLLSRGVPPSPALWPCLAHAWRSVVEHGLGPDAADRPITIGLAGVLGAAEDFDEIRAHARAAAAAFPRARLVLGEIDQLRFDAGGASLRSVRLEVLFRYYPLDWCETPALAPLLDVVAAQRLVMIPGPHAVVSQSKAFLALLHELAGHGFFPPEDAAAIRAYVPPTAVDHRRLGARWVAKPFLEREGHGVRFSDDLPRRERQRLERAGAVFQERLDLVSARIPVATARGWRVERRFLVFGVFLAGDGVAGVYTRAGNRITGREAVFLPLVLPS
jgi:glutathionylspermidine synthase